MALKSDFSRDIPDLKMFSSAVLLSICTLRHSLICCISATRRITSLEIFRMNSYLIQLELLLFALYFIHHLLGLGDECAELCDDTANGSRGSFWIRLNRHIIRFCSTHQFRNLQVNWLDSEQMTSKKNRKHFMLKCDSFQLIV